MKVFSFTDWLASGGSASTSNYMGAESYFRSSWVYAAVNRIALTASSAPLVFYQGDPTVSPTYNADEIIVDKSHPVLKLFNPPKFPIILSLRDLLYRTFIHLGIDGKLFWVIERKGLMPTNIDIRHKNALRPILTGQYMQELVGWEDYSYGKKYKLEEVLLIQEYRPDVPVGLSLDGLSPLVPARTSLDSEHHINGWNTAFFRAGMKNPLLIQAKGMLNKDQKAEIRKEIINYYSGIDGGHGALLLQGGLDITPLNVSSKDVDFINGKKLNREEILGIFGVPPSLVGLFEYSSYANAEEQTKTFWEQTLLPKMAAILDLIQINILDISFPGVYAAWDTSKVAGLRPNPATLAAPAKVYMDLGYYPSQVAKIVGMPSLVPDANFDKLRMDRQEQQLEYQQQLQQIMAANRPDPAPATTEDPKKPKPKPKKDLEVYAQILSSKLKTYSSYLCDESGDLDFVWDLTIRSYVRCLLNQCQYDDVELAVKVFDGFANSDAADLFDNSDEIAKIFIQGIYNQTLRH